MGARGLRARCFWVAGARFYRTLDECVRGFDVCCSARANVFTGHREHRKKQEEDEEGEAPPLPALLLASTRSSARIVATSVFPPAVGAE